MLIQLDKRYGVIDGLGVQHWAFTLDSKRTLHVLERPPEYLPDAAFPCWLIRLEAPGGGHLATWLCYHKAEALLLAQAVAVT